MSEAEEDDDWIEDEDEDDMDFDPELMLEEQAEYMSAQEDDADNEEVDGDELEDDEGESERVELELDDVSEEGEGEGNGDQEQNDSTQRSNRQRTRIQVPAQLMRLLGSAGVRSLLVQHGRQSQLSSFPVRGDTGGDEDEEEGGEEEETTTNADGDGQPPRRRSSRIRRKPKPNFPKVPSDAGRNLVTEGVFGGAAPYDMSSAAVCKQTLARKLMHRELGPLCSTITARPRILAESLLPASKADKVVHYRSRCYSGQFSDDGNFFFSCAQDFKVRMYDTSSEYNWRYYKTVDYPCGQWTITDATLSPDNKHLAYSSIRSIVCLSTTDPDSRTEPYLLDFADAETTNRSRRTGFQGYSQFGIWSLRFSGDGREIVAGTSGPSVCVYDIERKKTIINIDDGHTQDVNAVCFGDASSPHILYSGSDDSLIKVWDRRSLSDRRAAGVFMGHTEGLTYVDSKGDGRYVLSNGKDQTMRLWDLRKMMDTSKADNLDPERYTTGFDYRFMDYASDKYSQHPHDCSVVTYIGHSVLRTLIRCHFSPPGSTNSRYVYTGSEDGNVYIYNIDATLAGKIDVNEATKEPVLQQNMDGSGACPGLSRRERNSWKTCVRDVSWHPRAPMIAATSWNGFGMSAGSCTIHSWNDGTGSEEDQSSSSKGVHVNQWLMPQTSRNSGTTQHTGRQGLRSQNVTAALQESDDDEDISDEDADW